MIADILIMTYVLLFSLLIYQSEKCEEYFLKIIIIGALLTPIVGFAFYFYHHGKKIEKLNSESSIHHQ